jgi:predicted helicase
MAVTIYDILNEFRQAQTSNRDLGDKFERLMAAYLVTDPLYKDKYSDVWLWTEWPGRKNQPDTGIDLVAQERATGEYCAIQCKFYDPNYALQKGDIDSFFTTSGKAPFTSRMIISTTDKWSKHAEEALVNQSIPVIRLRVQDLDSSPVDWSQFSLNRPQDIKLKAKKTTRPHQIKALENVEAGFKEHDRGKLIMACGTGKTYTALKIAEKLASESGYVLFLVPSISLLSQTLREWTAEAELTLHPEAVCSDTKVGKDSEDISAHDLALPATTKPKLLIQRVKAFAGKKQLNVIFSTYQSIQVISEAQGMGLPEFDLIICDEAHRTTGVTLAGDDESQFVRVHDQNFIKAKKRLYMTATPRLYDDSAKAKAKESNAELCSMDDETKFGPEFHRLGFGEAVENNLLSDYKVLVLAVDEKYVTKAFQSQLADEDNELNLDDAVKIVGCWNGLSKKRATNADGGGFDADDLNPMRRAVAFSRTIKDSKAITGMFSKIIDEYVQKNPDDESLLSCEIDHVDGSFNALRRNKLLDWLKEDQAGQGNICRILSNARCLSEGVDVPALDAVMFLNPRNSVVDVVQSVGRVMRKADNKKYGYIILPIGIPADIKPEDALNDNKKYKVVWQVLQALRAHDDRFNAIINKIELNKQPPDQIKIIGVGGDGEGKDRGETTTQLPINLPMLEEWRDAIYAKIVIKCGDRRYWEDWAKDVAKIAQRHIDRINLLLKGTSKHKVAFDEFLTGLQTNLNPSISQEDAIEMLAQHLVTKPVFDALFEGYEFTQKNPVSLAMQKMLDLMEEQALEKETATLEKFYKSVRDRVKDIDNAEGKQTVIKELYEKFFRNAFPKLAEKMGIVYTPIEVVDFIINSADAALRKEFGVGLSDKDVHVLDPFTGTGTFMVRLLQSGLINPKDLPYKYKNELHANEIVLLAYYIAAINIEETYHALIGKEYQPFEGIVLTDTFQLSEGQGSLTEKMFPENNQRAAKQSKNDIRVIVGNPPYSAGQGSENDSNKNLKYAQLDERIRQTYAAHSSATLKNSLYDSYIRAIRWASDRIKDKGIICYVSNGGFIDGSATDGLRKCLKDEFSSIYCFNLRGNQRTSGEISRMEGGKIFGSGSRATVAITLLIKNPARKEECQLFYHDIGNYLSREDKLQILTNLASIQGIDWQPLIPNDSHDWINHRNPAFEAFIPMGDKDDKQAKTIFEVYSNGLKTNRDTWAYNFSKSSLKNNMSRMIALYNEQVNAYKKACEGKSKKDFPEIEKFIDNDPKKISWSVNLKKDLEKNIIHSFCEENLIHSMYRPYCKNWLYYNNRFNERPGQMPKIFPKAGLDNLTIGVTGVGVVKEFAVLITNILPDLCLHGAATSCQFYPLFTYEKTEETAQTSLLADVSGGYRKKENISDSVLAEFRKNYDAKLTKEDIFYYIYGILHSPEYQNRFGADIKKMLPRIPLAHDFWAFSKAGRALAEWHLNYETIEPYPLDEVAEKLQLDPDTFYKVQKMTFARNGKEVDKTTIVYNSYITLSGIPLEIYDYKVCDKSALEWIIERYQVTKDPDSGIENDPNDCSDDPRYIIDLLKRIVRVSIETVKIVNSLPALNEHTVAEASLTKA